MGFVGVITYLGPVEMSFRQTAAKNIQMGLID